MPQPTRTRTNTRRLPLPASGLEALLLLHMAVAGLPVPEQQYPFARSIGRRWRFDFAWPNANGRGGIAVEVDGGTWNGGRHVSGRGFEADCVKLNEAALMGWLVLRFTRGMIESGVALEMVQRALSLRTAARTEGVA